MQGLSGNNQAEPIDRARIYTATGDAVARQQYKDSLLGQVLEGQLSH